MASLRDIRNRIAAVKNTRQITNAMKMVAGSKLRRATESATNARPYQQALSATLRRVAQGAGDVEEPLLASREVKKVVLVVVGTDRGLCGGFNATLGRRSEDWIRKTRSEGKEIEVWTYGKKLRDFFKSRGQAVAQSRTDLFSPTYAQESVELGARLAQGFLAGEFDEAYIGFNQFKSTLTQVPTFSRILPLTLDLGGAEQAGGIEYKYEPNGPEILSALLPMYLRALLLQTFLENEAGEHASRMQAMDNATRNANDLIKNLTLDYNRGRQAAITKELIEIVSGAEAL